MQSIHTKLVFQQKNMDIQNDYKTHVSKWNMIKTIVALYWLVTGDPYNGIIVIPI